MHSVVRYDGSGPLKVCYCLEIVLLSSRMISLFVVGLSTTATLYENHNEEPDDQIEDFDCVQALI